MKGLGPGVLPWGQPQWSLSSTLGSGHPAPLPVPCAGAGLLSALQDKERAMYDYFCPSNHKNPNNEASRAGF